MSLKYLLKSTLLTVLLATGPVPMLGAGTIPNNPTGVAVSSFKGIKLDALGTVVASAFSASHFSLVSLTSGKDVDGDSVLHFRFSYPLTESDGSKPAIINVKVDGKIDRKGICTLCFLRDGYFEDSASLRKYSWMNEYELRSRLYPDLDKAFSTIQVETSAYIENPRLGYRPVWDGDKNRHLNSNSYLLISLNELKGSVIRSFEDAGFVLIEEKNSTLMAGSGELQFVFPYASGQKIGAKYSVGIHSQLDANGRCYPCEVVEIFDPYQDLPSPGLGGVIDRATLPARFEASLNLAQDNMQAANARYLRPGTAYFRPMKTAPLGTPRPARSPIAT